MKMGHILPSMNHFEFISQYLFIQPSLYTECVSKFPEKEKNNCIVLFSIFLLKMRCNLLGNDVDISFLLVLGSFYVSFVYFFWGAKK